MSVTVTGATGSTVFPGLGPAKPLSKKEHKRAVVSLRQELLELQAALRAADFPVYVLLCGVDGAGKGETTNLLNEWLDPHWMVTRAFGTPTQEEQERPQYWRFWRDLPPKGHLGVFLSAWYSEPLVSRAFGEISTTESHEVLSIAEELGFTRPQAFGVRSQYREHLAELRRRSR